MQESKRPSVFDPERVRAFYDAYGIKEWERLASSAHRKVIYHLHWHFLREHLGPGRAVLDAGCGAGRFSIAIAETGSPVVALDISGEQLRIARSKVEEAGMEPPVTSYLVGDVRALPFPDASFDTTVCYGAVLNYLFADAEGALRELVRVTRPGGAVLVSVGSRWGCLRFVAANEGVDVADFFGRPDYWHIFGVAETGDLPEHERVPQPARHFFESSELADLMARVGLEEVRLASAAALTEALYARLEAIEQVPAAWATILDLEERAYRRPGLLDTGEFLLAKGRKSS
jgi:ubiquinone/menaquinone biosynthesis C-methylase UbiE